MSSWHRETISAEYKNKPKKEKQTLLYVGRGAEDMEPLQTHSDGAQFPVHLLQTFL